MSTTGPLVITEDGKREQLKWDILNAGPFALISNDGKSDKLLIASQLLEMQIEDEKLQYLQYLIEDRIKTIDNADVILLNRNHSLKEIKQVLLPTNNTVKTLDKLRHKVLSSKMEYDKCLKEYIEFIDKL